jgi:NADPH2:quinone reductase
MATLLTPKGKPRAISTTTMKAAAIDRFGPPEVIKLHEVPMPDIEPHEVLIELYGAGVGVWDIEVRTGAWRPKGRPKFPLILGLDGAGVVAAKGSRVRNLHVGDRVWSYDWANKKGGFYAEYVAVDHDLAAPVPEHLSLLEAGAGCVTSLTAFEGIEDHLRVRKGEVVLIFGATGAVGTHAVQFANRRLAHVVATASHHRGAVLVRKLGADTVIDARKDDAPDKLRQIAPDGIDAVLALSGGDNLERLLDLVRDGGRVAWPNGVDPEPRKRRKLEMMSYDAEASPRDYARLKRAAEEIPLQVPINTVYPLADAAKAHEQLETSQVLGRIVLRIRREK